MSQTDDDFKLAFTLWHDFKDQILYKNRFFIEHEVLDHIKNISEKCRITVNKGTVLYRARLFNMKAPYFSDKEDQEESERSYYYKMLKMAQEYDLKKRRETGFWGFNKDDSFVPSNNDLINDGRANPSYIKYLYTAEKPYTAMTEVRPFLKSLVSIADIMVTEDLSVVDFSFDSFSKFDEGFEANLIYLIMSDFSNPTGSDNKNYIPTQYLSEFIKTIGFEGIRFSSSLHNSGRNITIFSYEKCQPVGSKLYNIEDICLEAKSVYPMNEYSPYALTHEKLVPYRMEQFTKTLQLISSKQSKK
jgi:RES domain